MEDGGGAVGRAAAERFRLGALVRRSLRVEGGLLNVMWRLDTELGTFAVKQVKLRHDRPHMAYRYRRAMELEVAALEVGVLLPRPVPDPRSGEPLARVGMDSGEIGLVVHHWTEGERVPDGPVDADFAGRVGDALGRIHSLGLRPLAEDLVAQPAQSMPSREEWEAAAGRAERDGWPWAEELRRAVPALAEIGDLVDGLAAPDGRSLFSHRDIGQKNLLRRGDDAVVLDWEAAGPVGVAEELGHTLLDLVDAAEREPDEQALRAFLAAYARHRPLPDLSAAWLSDWFSAFTHFAYFNVGRCLGDYGDRADELEIPSSVVTRAVRDLPSRLDRVEPLLDALRRALP